MHKVHKAVRSAPVWEGEMRRIAKRALVGLSFLAVAIALPVIAKQLGLKEPAYEAMRSAAVLMAGLGWYAIWWPRSRGRMGVRLLVIFWVAVALFWIAVMVNSGEQRQVVMESFAIGITVLSAEMTLREVGGARSAPTSDRRPD